MAGCLQGELVHPASPEANKTTQGVALRSLFVPSLLGLRAWNKVAESWISSACPKKKRRSALGIPVLLHNSRLGSLGFQGLEG